MCASNVYSRTSRREGLYVRISFVLPDLGHFAEMRTEKEGLRRKIVYTLDAYSGAEPLKGEAEEAEEVGEDGKAEEVGEEGEYGEERGKGGGEG